MTCIKILCQWWDSVTKRQEGPMALKVSCGKCGNGLGHEFLGDGPKGTSRFWIFSHSLRFVTASGEEAKNNCWK